MEEEVVEQNKSVIIVAPKHSTATMLSTKATDLLNDYFVEKGYRTFYLDGFQARKVPLLLALNQTEGDRRLIIYIGHGTPDSLIGDELGGWSFRKLQLLNTDQDIFNQAVLNKFGENDIVVTIACESIDLGEHMVYNQGVQSFFTSSEKMWIGTGFDTETEQDEDFIQLFVMIPMLLEQGMSTYMALEHYKFQLRHYLTYAENEEYLKYQFMNLNYYEMIGENTTW